MRNARPWLPGVRPIAGALLAAFASASVANPTGPKIAAGAATFQTSGKNLTVTNAPGTILNWQSFSIGAGEITRFQQQSSMSAVLNRVVGANASSILGQLQSNGRVFLVNPHGIVFGAGSVINTAGFVASTLNMSDRDFLAGRLKFEGGGNGVLRNEGTIQAGGDIFLVGPRIENAGLIRSDAGSVLLAAGQSLTITSPDAHGVQFALQAPADSALNLGTIEARNAVGLFAGTLRHSGEIRAVGASVDGAGRVLLAAQKDAIVDGNATISADSAVGKGGSVQVLGERVGLLDQASISARGATGGGEILIGGDFQGKNAEVHNAWRTYVGKDVVLSADATAQGDGGKVIVWSDDVTRYFGHASVRGGPQGGNGGLVEVSGKGSLVYAGSVALGAPLGKGGMLLLDPTDINLVGAGGTLDGEIGGTGDPSILFAHGGGSTDLSVGELTTGFTSGDTIVLEATNNINFFQGVTLQSGVNLGLHAGNQINVTQPLDTNGGNLSLSATTSTLAANVTANAFTVSGALTLPSGTLTATGDITVNGAFNGGNGTIAAGGGGNFITGGVSTVNNFLTVRRNWTNNGTINLDNGVISLDGVTFTNNGTLNINTLSTQPFNALGNSIIVNGGILNKNSSVTALFGNPFTNQAAGTLNVNDGTLQSTSNSSFDGNVIVAAGKTLEFTNSAATNTLLPGVSLGGSGRYLLSGGTLDVQSGSLPRLELTSGNLTRTTPGDLTISGAFDLVTGNITTGGGGDLVTAGTTTVTSSSTITRNWRNTGTININDTFIGLSGVTFTNQGTVNVTGTNTTPFHSLGTASIVNGGIINMNSTATVRFGNPFTNQAAGTLNVNDGTVQSTLNSSFDGNVIVAAGKTLEFTNSAATNTLLPGVTLGGSGRYLLNGGTLDVQSGSLPRLELTSGNLTRTTPGDLTINGAFDLVTGNITTGGGGDLVTAGTTTVTSFSTVTRNWRNTGTINIDSTFIGLSGVTFTNQGTVNINTTNTTPFHSLGTASIVNSGTINKNSTGESSMGNPFTNQAAGIVNVNNGFVQVAQGGTLDGTFNLTGEFVASAGTYGAGGTFNGLAGGPLSVTGATLNLSDGAVLNLADNLNFTGGAINLTGGGAGASVAAGSTLTLAGTTFGGAGKLSNLGTLNLNGGTINGTLINQGALNATAGDGTINGALSSIDGTTTVAGGRTLNVGGTGLDWQGGTLAGAGTYNLTGGLTFSGAGARVLNGPTFNVANFALPGGSLDVQTGALNLSGASSTSAGATLLVSGGALTSSGTLANAGTLTHAAAGTSTLAGAFTNSGTVNANAGTLDFAGGYSQSAGALVLAGGGASGNLTLNGGDLTGVGTITGNVINTGGTVRPGASPGTLVINGNYTQGAGGTLAIELGGTSQGVNYDLLQVTGTATLNGTLNVSLFGGFTGAAGNLFDVMTYASSSGDFSTFGFPAGYTMTGTPNPAFYQLAIAALPSPPAGAASGLQVLDPLLAIPANNNLVLLEDFLADVKRSGRALYEAEKGVALQCR